MNFRLTATQKGNTLLLTGSIGTPVTGYTVEFWPLKVEHGIAVLSLNVCEPETPPMQAGLGRVDVKREYQIPTLVRAIKVSVNDLFSFEIKVDQLPL